MFRIGHGYDVHKLVEGRKNALYFAKSVAKATGQEAEYTRKKGFDDDYYKDLILKALDQHKTLGRKAFNDLLINKLPDALTEKQKLSKVGNLLTSLRMAGKIVCGEDKKWYIRVRLKRNEFKRDLSEN